MYIGSSWSAVLAGARIRCCHGGGAVSGTQRNAWNLLVEDQVGAQHKADSGLDHT